MNQLLTPRYDANQQKHTPKLVRWQTTDKNAFGSEKSQLPVPRQLNALIRWIVTGFVVFASVLYFGQTYFFGPIVLVDKIKQQDILQTIVASGRVETPFRINVGTQITGTVKNVPTAEGQAVIAGDILIELDDTDAREVVKLAQGVVAQWRLKLDQLSNVSVKLAEETKAQAQAAVADSQITFDRAQNLYRLGYGTKVSLDTARKALDIAQSQARAADLQVATSSPGGMDYLSAQTQLDQAIASMHSAEAKLAYYRIKASRDGTLISRSVERGNVVQPSSVLMVLAPAGEIQIVIQIDETNLGLLKVGQKATISADAYPKQNFSGQLGYINPSINAQSGSVEVKLSVPNPPVYLRQDMTVSVEIEVAHIANSVAIDAGSIRDIAGKGPWVMVVENGRTSSRNITVGIVGDAAVEVDSGLKSGDVVVRGTNPGLTLGQRVRVQLND